jgi:hypothetical protein
MFNGTEFDCAVASPFGPQSWKQRLICMAVSSLPDLVNSAVEIAEATRLSERTVRKCLRELVADGWLRTQERCIGTDWETVYSPATLAVDLIKRARAYHEANP